MAVRKRVHYIEQPTQPVTQPTRHTQPKQPPAIKRRALITKQEKLLYLAFVVVVALMAVTILHKQGEIQTATIEIQKLESSINTVAKQNVDYKVQISEKSTFERIMAKAKERGLTLNEDNVKVVPGE